MTQPQYIVLKVDREDRIYVPTMLKYVGQIGTESKYANKYSRLVCLEFEDGNAWRFRNEWLEKVKEKQMTKFKVGDKVRVIESDYHGIPIGRIGTILDEESGSVTLHIVNDYESEYMDWPFFSYEIELVEESEQVNQPVIEIGKKYRVVKVEKDWKFYCPELEDYLYMEGTCISGPCGKHFDYVDIKFENGESWSFASEWLVPVEEEINQSSQDNVNFPSHYQLVNDVEVKDVVKIILSRWQSSGQEMSFNQAGMMKELLQYLLRAPLKNKKEDVLKAQWYLNELVKEWEDK